LKKEVMIPPFDHVFTAVMVAGQLIESVMWLAPVVDATIVPEARTPVPDVALQLPLQRIVPPQPHAAP
jgi:hypothetical protein